MVSDGRCLVSLSYPLVCPRQVLFLDVLAGCGFVLSFRCFALGVGFGVIRAKSEKALAPLFFLRSLVGSTEFDLVAGYIFTPSV